MLKDYLILYIFIDCKEFIIRNLVDGLFILLRRKRDMIMLVFFLENYLRNGWKIKKVFMVEWKWR